MKNIMIY